VEHNGDQRVERASSQRRTAAIERGTHQRDGRRCLQAGPYALGAQRAYHLLPSGLIVAADDGLLADHADRTGASLRDRFGVLKL
jgi:hypothetical protein